MITLLTKTDLESRVTRGAAHLDAVRPGWADAIDLDALRMETCERCVLGQLFRGFDRGLEALNIRRIFWCASAFEPTDAAVEQGFALADVEYEERGLCGYRWLKDAWIAAIADRRGLRGDPVVDGGVSASAAREIVGVGV